VESEDILSNYELAKNNGNLKKSQAIEILFLEIFVRLSKREGFIVIVLPDGTLSNPQYQYAREFILKNTKVLHIISLPRNIFEQTSAKTSILILEKRDRVNQNYFAELHDLGKTGKVNNTIKVSGRDLPKRMDYCYYHNLQKSPLRELIGYGLVFKPLKDFLVYCKTGKTLYGQKREFSKKGVRFLHATNITDIGINYKKDEKFVDPLGKMNFPNAYAKVGDVLFVRVGVGCAGRVAIVDAKDDEGVATDYIHLVRVKNINPYFLVIYLKTRYGRDSINLLKHGVGTVSINKTDLLSIPIPIVSEYIQIEGERRYKSILSHYRMASENSNPDIGDLMNNLIGFVERSVQKELI
jgi:type I restriction enzyme M protein